MMCYKNRQLYWDLLQIKHYGNLMVTLHKTTSQLLGECNESSKVSSGLSRIQIDTIHAVLVFMLWWQLYFRVSYLSPNYPPCGYVHVCVHMFTSSEVGSLLFTVRVQYI